MNKKTRSTKSEKWRHACNSVEIAWTNEQKVAVTSYGRNKNHDDEIKKTKRRPIIAPAIAVRLLKKIKMKSQKTTSEKANFCSNTVFSLYFKIRVEKFHATKPLASSFHFLFQRDQNTYSNLTSEIMKMCEQIKDSAPIQFKFFEL